MTITLALILWALRIRNFEAVNDRAEIISVYGDDWPTPEQFYEDRVGDYASASSINRALNNDTASLLSWGSLSMASPVLCCYDCRCLLVVILREAEDLLLPVAIAWFFYLDDAISWNLSNNYKKASFRPEQRGVIARRSGETPVFRSCRWPCSSLLSYPLQVVNSSLDEGNLSAHTRVLHTVFSPANNPHT